MLLSEHEICDCVMYGDECIPKICEELIRWRNAFKKIISQLNYIKESEVTDILLERYLEDMELKRMDY